MKLKCVSTATTEREISMSDGLVRANVEYTRLFELATSRQYCGTNNREKSLNKGLTTIYQNYKRRLQKGLTNTGFWNICWKDKYRKRHIRNYVGLWSMTKITYVSNYKI